MAKKHAKKGRVARELSSVHLGRYPFLAGINHYVKRKGVKLSPVTIEEDVRKLRQFAGLFERWKKEGKISTTDPRHIGPDAIEEFYRHMRRRGLQSSTQRTYVTILNRYLTMYGNHVIEDMVDEADIDIPVAEEKEIRALDLEELRSIFAAAEQMEGYKGILIRGLLALGFGTGCRPKELFGAELQDLDLKNEMYFIRHPKGEGSWGKKEWVNIIRTDMIPRLERFVAEREAFLATTGLKTKYLFANISTGLPMTGKALRVYKEEVALMAGVPFAIKDLRPTLTTMLVDDDPAYIEATSKQLRHSKSDTTKKFYLKINTRKAVKNALGDRWKNNEI